MNKLFKEVRKQEEEQKASMMNETKNNMLKRLMRNSILKKTSLLNEDKNINGSDLVK